MNIFYKATLEKIGLNIRDLKSCATTLYRFIGEGIVSLGAINLLVTLGEYPMSVKKITEFIVVDTPLAYNVISRRLILITLGEVSFVRHLSIKLPTLRRIGTVKGDHSAARECYNLSTRGRGNSQPKHL